MHNYRYNSNSNSAVRQLRILMLA